MRVIKKITVTFLLVGVSTLSIAEVIPNKDYMAKFKAEQRKCIMKKEFSKRNVCIAELRKDMRLKMRGRQSGFSQEFNKNRQVKKALENRRRMLEDAKGQVPKRW